MLCGNERDKQVRVVGATGVDGVCAGILEHFVALREQTLGVGVEVVTLHDDAQRFALLEQCARRPDLDVDRHDLPGCQELIALVGVTRLFGGRRGVIERAFGLYLPPADDTDEAASAP